MMIVDKFNRKLEKYSHNLTSLKLLRAAFGAITSQNLLSYLAEEDDQEKGYFTSEEITRKWLSEHSQQQEVLLHFMRKYFNFPKISYTIIINFLTKHQPLLNDFTSYRDSIDELVKNIFKLQLETSEIQDAIVEKLEFFVPMKYSRPTEQELSRYVICQQLTVDIREVAKSLNLLQSNSELNKKHEVGYEKTLANPSVSNLQDIMKRLQSKVNSLGGQWLTAKQAQK